MLITDPQPTSSTTLSNVSHVTSETGSSNGNSQRNGTHFTQICKVSRKKTMITSLNQGLKTLVKNSNKKIVFTNLSVFFYLIFHFGNLRRIFTTTRCYLKATCLFGSVFLDATALSCNAKLSHSLADTF